VRELERSTELRRVMEAQSEELLPKRAARAESAEVAEASRPMEAGLGNPPAAHLEKA